MKRIAWESPICKRQRKSSQLGDPVNDGAVRTRSLYTSTFIGSVLTKGIGKREVLAESGTTGAVGPAAPVVAAPEAEARQALEHAGGIAITEIDEKVGLVAAACKKRVVDKIRLEAGHRAGIET